MLNLLKRCYSFTRLEQLNLSSLMVFKPGYHSLFSVVSRFSFLVVVLMLVVFITFHLIGIEPTLTPFTSNIINLVIFLLLLLSFLHLLEFNFSALLFVSVLSVIPFPFLLYSIPFLYSLAIQLLLYNLSLTRIAKSYCDLFLVSAYLSSFVTIGFYEVFTPGDYTITRTITREEAHAFVRELFEKIQKNSPNNPPVSNPPLFPKLHPPTNGFSTTEEAYLYIRELFDCILGRDFNTVLARILRGESISHIPDPDGTYKLLLEVVGQSRFIVPGPLTEARIRFNMRDCDPEAVEGVIKIFRPYMELIGDRVPRSTPADPQDTNK